MGGPGSPKGGLEGEGDDRGGRSLPGPKRVSARPLQVSVSEIMVCYGRQLE